MSRMKGFVFMFWSNELEIDLFKKKNHKTVTSLTDVSILIKTKTCCALLYANTNCAYNFCV